MPTTADNYDKRSDELVAEYNRGYSRGYSFGCNRTKTDMMDAVRSWMRRCEDDGFELGVYKEMLIEEMEVEV